MKIVVAVEGLLHHLRSVGYADNTVKLYRIGLDCFCRHLETVRIDDIRRVTPKIVEDFKRSLMQTDISPESRALRLRPIKRLFEHLVRNRELLINPAENLTEITRKRHRIGPVLTQTEMKRLLAMSDRTTPAGIRNRAVMEVLYATGIRLGELLGLQTTDVDLPSGLLFIRRGKGSRQRTVPLGESAAKSLLVYIRNVRPELAGPDREGGPLFLTVAGEPLTRAAVRAFLRQYRLSANIETPVSPHVFRRSCATHFLKGGADIRFVQELLGHASLRETHAYTKVLPLEVKRTHEQTHPGVVDEGD